MNQINLVVLADPDTPSLVRHGVDKTCFLAAFIYMYLK
jgi:hypothetical protein